MLFISNSFQLHPNNPNTVTQLAPALWSPGLCLNLACAKTAHECEMFTLQNMAELLHGSTLGESHTLQTLLARSQQLATVQQALAKHCLERA